MKFTIETTNPETMADLHEAVFGAAQCAPCTLRIEWDGAPTTKVVVEEPGLSFRVEQGTTGDELLKRVKAQLDAHKVAPNVGDTDG